MVQPRLPAWMHVLPGEAREVAPPKLSPFFNDSSQDYRLTKGVENWYWDGVVVEKPVEENSVIAFAIARFLVSGRPRFPQHDKRNFGNLATTVCPKCGNTSMAKQGKREVCGKCFDGGL